MVAQTEIKNLIPGALYEELLKLTDEESEATVFDQIKPQVLQVIQTATGIDTSVDTRTEAQNWIVLPFAWLVEYIAGDMISGLSPEGENRRTSKYKSAMSELAKHVVKNITGGLAVLGSIHNQYEAYPHYHDDYTGEDA